MAEQLSPRRTTATRRTTARPAAGGPRAGSEGRRVTRTAAEGAREITGAVRTQAAQVGGELTDQGRALLDEARARLAEQAEVQVRRAGDGLARVAKGARALGDDVPGDAASVGSYLAQGADRLHDAADRLYRLADDVGAGDFEVLVEDLQRFARRRPAVFLAGAAVAGFGMGRVLRAAGADDGDDDVDADPSGALGDREDRGPARPRAGGAVTAGRTR